jgi:hypothetical protein
VDLFAELEHNGQNTLGGNEVVDIRERQSRVLHEVSAAGASLQAAKRTHSVATVARAEGELHAAVDAARELDVEWGRIGSALGIARGCAYQRYRKRAAHAASALRRNGSVTEELAELLSDRH